MHTVSTIAALQKVIRHTRFAGARRFVPWRWVERNDVLFPRFVDLHDGCLVPAPVAIVRCTKEGDYLLGMRFLETFHDKLVGTHNLLKIIDVVELLAAVFPERVAGTTWGYTPPTPVVGVGPHQVT